ncbi:N-acetyltransferase domain-containing protein [Aphelenchoides bicaudatus]|nr:N-acetyltransferase domain-containing protein [Aphelenchoides bicaudatus]
MLSLLATKNLCLERQCMMERWLDILMICNLSQLELKDGQPTLPYAYQLPKTERRLLDEVRVQRLDLPLRYEIAVPEDEPVIRDFMINEYYRQTNIPRTLQCQKEDGQDLMTRFKPECIYDELVILAIYDGHLCAISVNRGVTVQPRETQQQQSASDIKIPDDFTQLIDSQPLRHIGGKTVRAINAWMEGHVPTLMPNDCDRFFMLNMLAVHPDFRGCGIANKLWLEALKLGRENNYRYVQCMCSAAGSCKAAENIGLKMVISLPYSKVTYKGQPLFPNGQVNDGGKLFNMYLGDLRQLLP